MFASIRIDLFLLVCLLNAAGCSMFSGTVRLPEGLDCPGLERELPDRAAEVEELTPRELLSELAGSISAFEPRPDGYFDAQIVACWWAAEQKLQGSLRHTRALHYREPGREGEVHVFTVGDTTILVHVYYARESFEHGLSGGVSHRIDAVAGFRGRLQDLIELDCSNGQDCQVIPQAASPAE